MPWKRGASALAFACFSIAAAAATMPDAKPDPKLDIVALLTRIQQSAQQQNYVGTYIHQQGAQVQASRVIHLQDKGGEFEKLELMDGQAREFIRHNDDVRCYVPDSKLLLMNWYDTFIFSCSSAICFFCSLTSLLRALAYFASFCHPLASAPWTRRSSKLFTPIISSVFTAVCSYFLCMPKYVLKHLLTSSVEERSTNSFVSNP